MPQQYYRSLDTVRLDSSWLTIGVFDGIHRGHQEIIRRLTAGAHANGAPAVVLTFNPHPANVLAGRDIKYLTTPDERVAILFQLGVDAVISIEFTHELAEQTAENFMANLKRHLDLKKLLIGHDFALGKNRTGNIERLTQLGLELGYQVSVVDPVRGDKSPDYGRYTTVISSTIIRQAVADGHVRLAADQLNRPYSMTGPVIAGDGRGRTIGMPTANIDVPSGKALPRNGVYACWALLGKERYRAVVNIGLRPTFENGKVFPRVEAHLLDYAADLYNQTMTLEFIEHLRDEQKFSAVETLVSQIKADIQMARTLLP